MAWGTKLLPVDSHSFGVRERSEEDISFFREFWPFCWCSWNSWPFFWCSFSCTTLMGGKWCPMGWDRKLGKIYSNLMLSASWNKKIGAAEAAPLISVAQCRLGGIWGINIPGEMVFKFHSGWKWEHLHEGNSNWGLDC